MTNYRRHFIAGGSYFFTVNLAERSSVLLTENIHALRTAWREVRRELPLKAEAVVVLPIICIAFGRCRPEMLIFPHVGEKSKPPSHVTYPKPSDDQRAD